MKTLVILFCVMAIVIGLVFAFLAGYLAGSISGLKEALDYVDVLDKEPIYNDKFLEKQQYISGWIDACRFIINFKRGKKWSE